MLITRSDFPAKTLPEFIAYAKANQGKMQYSSAGAGSGSHVCAVLLDVAMGTKITHVPYRGAGPAMQDLIAGRIDFMAEQISTALPQIQGGKVKAIATMGLDRAPGLEQLATAEELGLKGLDCGSWGSFSFPKGTPAAIVQRLAQASNEAVESPMVRDRFRAIGVVVPAKERRTHGLPAQIRRDRNRALGGADQEQRRSDRLNAGRQPRHCIAAFNDSDE